MHTVYKEHVIDIPLKSTSDFIDYGQWYYKKKKK